MPFVPLTITRSGAGDQALIPLVDPNGQLVWQAGDTSVTSGWAEGVGWCHGSARNEKVFADISVGVYLTGARIVAYADKFAKGSKRSGPLIASAVGNAVSQHRATKAADGQYLVGQMRWPWVNLVAYSVRTNRKTENTVRVAGTHRSAFGDEETVMLILHLGKHDDPTPLAHEIVRRVVADRLGVGELADDKRQRILAATWAGLGDEGTIPHISIPGAYLANAASAYLGGTSHLSQPAA